MLHAHEVHLGGVEEEPCAEVEPEDQAEDDGEESVDLGGPLELVNDEVAAQLLEDGPAEPADDRAGQEQAVTVRLGRQDVQGDEVGAHVGHGAEDDQGRGEEAGVALEVARGG